MIKDIKAVIGGNWGDEAKGHLVDYLASTIPNDTTCCVVRYNGGSQAGHTVEHDGMRHVFNTYSSGTFAKADTFLSEYFIHNPILFIKEREKCNVLVRYHMDKIYIYAHGNGIVTTPFDMIVNQHFENNRTNRHGSCGVGINQTIVRNKIIPLTMNDIHSLSFMDLNDRIKEIQKYSTTIISNIDSISLDDMRDQFLEDIHEYLQYIHICENNDQLKKYDHIIFEGAQGLLLDEEHEWFPHVTHSKTGSDNIIKILTTLDTDIKPTITYVSRSYMTRHGAGPFPSECPKPYKTIYDKTNVPNEFQETLRYGLFDFELFTETVKADFAKWEGNANMNIAITCMDQVPDCFDITINDQCRAIYKDAFIRNICKSVGPVKLISYGPDTKDIKECLNGENTKKS